MWKLTTKKPQYYNNCNFAKNFLFLVGNAIQRSPMCCFFYCPGSNSANLPIGHLSPLLSTSWTESWKVSISVSHTIQFFRQKSLLLPSWGEGIELLWKKTSVSHLAIAQVHWFTLSFRTGLFLITFLMQGYLQILTHFHLSQTSLSSLPITHILARPNWLPPSGTRLLLTFYPVYSWSKHWN